jgi:hypothetical protein
MRLQDWADVTVYDLETYGPIARLEKESEWQNWAAGIIGINGISQQNPPSPYAYDDWREWAIRFYQVLD